MARKRSIKPEFFRDQALQMLELALPLARPMLTYAGLWTLADRQGTFKWDSYSIGFDLLPSVETYHAELAINILADAGFLYRFEFGGHDFGAMPEFTAHQSIQGNETRYAARYPDPPHLAKPDDSDRKQQERRRIVAQLRDRRRSLTMDDVMAIAAKWNIHGMTMEYPWNSLGMQSKNKHKHKHKDIPYGTSETFDGHSMEYPWNNHGTTKPEESPDAPPEVLDAVPVEKPLADPDAQAPFDVTARVLTAVFAMRGQPAPTREDVLRDIRHVPEIVRVCEDEGTAARLMDWATRFKVSMTTPKLKSGARNLLAEARQANFDDPTKRTQGKAPDLRRKLLD